MFLTVKQLEKDLSKKLDFYAYISGRGGRKSSAVQEVLINQAIRGHPFIILRNKVTHSISDKTFSKYVRTLFENRGYRFETRKSEVMRNLVEIYALREDEEILLCYGLFVSCAEQYKSNYFDGWEKISSILWEECVDNKLIMQDLSTQNVDAMSQQFYNVLSIHSTITRTHRAPIIALGNDIKGNTVNAITVNFNLIERLCEGTIEDTAQVGEKKIKFLFNYFRVGAPPEWLNTYDSDITQTVLNDYNYIIKTAYNYYYCGSNKQGAHIGQRIVNGEHKDILTYDDLLKKYDINIPLTPFELVGIVGWKNITNIDRHYEFYPDITSEVDIIDLDELITKTIEDITPTEVDMLKYLYFAKFRTYSNFAIKYKIQMAFLRFFKLIT